MTFIRQCTAVFMALSFASPALAELGDYSAWQTAINLFSPRPADNPVTAADQTGPYPLLLNPAGFDDGFSPGAYYAWQTIQMAPETGAVCGNGSPFKFFVNRVPNTSNTVVYFEGGGACWDYESCSGDFGIRGARNADGIPDDYMSLLNPGASLVSPFVVRLHPWTRTKAQNWNMVYVPYCTGDIYSGDTVAIYDDPAGQNEPLVWHHNGVRNTRAVVAWLKNNLERSGQMLATGCSAGGAGSFTNYFPLREDLAPTRGYLINDSGPIFSAPAGADPADHPSLPLHTHIRSAWGLDATDGPLEYLAAHMAGLDLDDLTTLYPALASQFPGDRMGHTHFWDDMNYSSYSYERFFPDIAQAPDDATREALILARWHQDTQRLQNTLSNLDNFGYYLPRYRAVNESHCTSIIEFANADIQELGLELDDFVNNVMAGSGAVMQASETDTQADRLKPFNLLYWTLDQLL
ncbi:pectinacetylesterase family protein [Alcanivorax quisquiliarum]|uniref:Pectinacetylesterase family protein n=1 Tax=Alcanivorax quisquiliarum TaxID=2933565 RepID=A0ABT0E317_9GAMM|nr:pectinacetylesterase family protein [Alcanivorax quisquiliarum]MCK0536199.1 pectinacetylesterase family protein [Alcanivorax quisquiliarum]